MPPPLILCPLVREAALLRRWAPSLPAAQVIGPGAAGCARVRALVRPGQLVILVGTAGGLRSPWNVGQGAVVGEVVPEPASPTGKDSPRSLRSTVAAPAHLRCARLATVDRPVTAPADKATLADRLDVDLVDCESAPIVESIEAAGGRWLVVRGVSDGPDEALPAEAAAWIDAAGNTRASRVGLDCLRRPRLLGSLVQLARGSRLAMRSAALLTLEVLGSLRDADSLRSERSTPPVATP